MLCVNKGAILLSLSSFVILLNRLDNAKIPIYFSILLLINMYICITATAVNCLSIHISITSISFHK